jgi:SAM-dependent methyltransferase
MGDRYDRIGQTYARTRVADPRIAARIREALGSARSVVNIGAGAGSYEPEDRPVVAVEPAWTMLQQRPRSSAPAVRAVAEALPFPDSAFDAALAVLTVHHWRDLGRGFSEMRRVASRQVVFYFEPSFWDEVWLVVEYFPEMLDLPTERDAPSGADIARYLEVVSVDAVPVPADCADGFGGSFWNRPEAYLDPVVQEGMSSFAQLAPEVRRRGTERLRADLSSGAWDERHGHLRTEPERDVGYRLLVAGDSR